MRTDRAALVGDAWIVARRRRTVMGTERLVSARQILLRAGIKIVEGCGETFAAMVLGNAAQALKSVLQAFGLRDKAFAAKQDMGMFVLLASGQTTMRKVDGWSPPDHDAQGRQLEPCDQIIDLAARSDSLLPLEIALKQIPTEIATAPIIIPRVSPNGSFY